MDTYKKALIEVMADIIDGHISDGTLVSIVSRLKLKFKDDSDLVNALEDTMVCAFLQKRESGSKLSPCATVILGNHKAAIKSWLTPEQIASLMKTMPMQDTTTPTTHTTSTTDSDKESNLKGGDATRKEATTMANNINTTVPTTPSVPTSTKSEAGELIANFIKNSLGNKLPKEYKIITGIVEAIPVISKAVKSALEIALIRAILTGEYPQLISIDKTGETLANLRGLIRAISNKNEDEVTINDLINILNYGSYDCQIDKEGRIAATLLYINLYK